MDKEKSFYEMRGDNSLEGKIVDIAETTLHSPKEILEEVKRGGSGKAFVAHADKIQALLHGLDQAEREKILNEAEALYRFANKSASDF